MSACPTSLRPSEFSRALLRTVAASEGRGRRRKRDQRPDRIGLDLKRELLERAIEDDPAPDGFEAWLLAQILSSPVSGPVRAICEAILDEYRLAQHDREFGRWLQSGAPSDDAITPTSPERA